VNGLADKPLEFAKLLWPDVIFYREQRQILHSIVENDETMVPAGNMLGKDFVGGFVAVWFFMTRTPCRVITTSVKDDHLRVLWGEIGRFIQSSRFPLTRDKGGPLIVNHRDVRKVIDLKSGVPCQISYLRGMVSEKGEGMAGHHAAHTLCIIDEASGVDDLVYNQQATWSRKLLAIGNPNPCPPNHWFRRGVTDGDLVASIQEGARDER
jgi:phage terminase large subunit